MLEGLIPVALRSERGVLLVVATMLVGLALIKGLAHLGQALLLDGTAEAIGHNLRVRLYSHLIRLPLQAHRRRHLGDLLTRLLDDIQRVQEATVTAPITLIREALGAAVLLAIAIWMSPRLALVAALALPVAGLVIGLLSRGVKRAAGARQHHLANQTSRATQGLGAIREVKSCGAEQREIRGFEVQGRQVLRWALRRILIRATGPMINELMAATALGITLLYAGSQISAGLLAPERFISFFAAVLLIYRPVKSIGQAAHLMAAGQASVQRVTQLLEEPVEDQGHGSVLSPLKRKVCLLGIHFGYGDGRRVLKGVDVQLEVGKIVAVAGPSGAGKTTLANIVCGLERPQAGTIIWDEEELSLDSPRDLRRRVALVPQQPLLLNATMAENLRYGAPEASAGELQEAMRAVGLEELVERLDRGYDTLIGAGGVELSVGEIQRLALARALLRGENLLVLDEPTSALDPDSETHLIATLRRLRRTMAILVVAHSERLIGIADRVAVLRDGRIDRIDARCCSVSAEGSWI